MSTKGPSELQVKLADQAINKLIRYRNRHSSVTSIDEIKLMKHIIKTLEALDILTEIKSTYES